MKNKDFLISFIMPAKNEAHYIHEAIGAIINADYETWELIIIDDHSDDNTYEVVSNWVLKDSRIRVFKNEGKGKIIGTNLGYNLAKGDIIKCIDADDVLDTKFFDHLNKHFEYDVMCHDCYVTSSDLSKKTINHMNPDFLSNDFEYCLKYLKSLPKWSWSFSRDIADKIFPMPESLPFEDVWISLIIKKNAARICYIPKQLYYYRQNDNQTYGGIFNFSRSIMEFRAKRMLKLINVLENEEMTDLMTGIEKEDFFFEIKQFYYALMNSNQSLLEIVRIKIPVGFIFRILIYKKLGFLVTKALKVKWAISYLKSLVSSLFVL
jgi:glycosyltransferase involved in cell wall biosynthesis